MPLFRNILIKCNQYSSAYFPAPEREAGDNERRKILLIHCHPCQGSFSHGIAGAVETAATEGGHEIRRIDLYEKTLKAAMSDKERAYYKMNMEGDPDKEKLLADDVKESIKALRWCDTLIFVYPTWWMNCPGLLKSWFDRSLVPGSTWAFPDENSKGAATGLVPKLTNIKRILGVSTYGATMPIVTLAGDNGRRMISTAIRPLFSPDCTCRWIGLYNMDAVDSKGRSSFLSDVQTIVRYKL